MKTIALTRLPELTMEIKCMEVLVVIKKAKPGVDMPHHIPFMSIIAIISLKEFHSNA